MDLIGKRFKTKASNEFTVLEKTKRNNKTYYRIRFDKVNEVEFELLSQKVHILDGYIKNPYFSSIVNIGYFGEPDKTHYSNDEYKRIQQTWTNMIRRCYDITNQDYKAYGAKGATVSKEWLNFAIFLKDYRTLLGYEKDIKKVLDSDILSTSKDIKIYSKNTCSLISSSENSKRS